MTQPPTPLRLFNSLTRQLEEFNPVHPGTEGDPNDPAEARVYTCGPTVYNYQHIGNMRAYIFADTLGRALSYKGYKLKHVINITDVGHLTSDADAGDDKMEKAASAAGKSAWDIAKFYTDAYWGDIERLNIRQPAHWSIATDYVPAMIDFAKGIADKHCYELESGLYFDTSTVADYGRLARAVTEDGTARIDEVEGKRHAADFAIWRKTPSGETRQMEWDSPWGKGAPGWHLECSVMSEALLGLPFDIHTGGIDHREIHHPNEIAQNQAYSDQRPSFFKTLRIKIRAWARSIVTLISHFQIPYLSKWAMKRRPSEQFLCSSDYSGARIWMHNNFLIDRTGKMSKSSGEFLTLQALVDRGFHPFAFRLMCLQAHYRSELEFSWENLAAAQTRLKRLVMGVERISAATPIPEKSYIPADEAELPFRQAVSDDLNTPHAVAILEGLIAHNGISPSVKLRLIAECDSVLGLNLAKCSRVNLRQRPSNAQITEAEIEAALDSRKEARAAKDFATSDRIRDDLIAKGVEVMDGDPLGWDWKIDV